MTQKTSISFRICHIFGLEINYFPVLLSVRVKLSWAVGLPYAENFAYKPELSFNPLARVTLAVGLPYLLVNRALENDTHKKKKKILEQSQWRFSVIRNEATHVHNERNFPQLSSIAK